MKNDCAQVTIDYIAGIGIFLLSVVFVFQFVYGLFIPFQSGSDKAALAADRAGTVLVEQMLHADTSGALNVIDQGKLYYFNNTQLNYSNQTAFNNALRQLGLFSNQTVFDLNISVTYIGVKSVNFTDWNKTAGNSSFKALERTLASVDSTFKVYNATYTGVNNTDYVVALGNSSIQFLKAPGALVANSTYSVDNALLSGPALPDNTDTAQTKRLVLIINSSTGYNETAIVSVRVW